MFTRPIVVADIETTGGSARYSRIIEIALIRIENGEVVDTFQSYVNPAQRLPHFITNLTGISENDLAGAPYFDAIADNVAKICDGAVFVAHNVRFDYSFIKCAMEENGYPFKPKLLCSARLSRFLYPEHKRHNLEVIINRHGLKTINRHRAFDDAKAVWDFLEIAYAEKGEEKFAEAVARQLKHASLPPNLNEAIFKELKNECGVYIFRDEYKQPVYIGKSKTIRNRVLSHFSQDIKSTKEMKLSLKTHTIEAIYTPNELDALLLESKLIKELLPVHNIKLRRKRDYFVLVGQKDADGYLRTELVNATLEETDVLMKAYGIFPTRRKAKEALETSAKVFSLCPKLLGLEKSTSSCFQYQLKRCQGACIGDEPARTYNERFETAFERTKVEQWPYASPIAVHIEDDQDNAHVIDQWQLIGYLRNLTGDNPYFQKVKPAFDKDNYLIIRGFLRDKKNLLKIKNVPLQTLEAFS
jgi:DNA polymerase III subunit epsilon